MKFKLQNTDSKSKARAGELETDHGTIKTPIFMPVGTAGTVKAVHQRELHDDIQAQIILGNTYHLYLRPGLEVIEAAGGLHGFNGWDKPILTDSGGYQVYSLGANRKITEKGVMFKSHIDGSKHDFTPERVMDVQRIIGADIIMAFDECTPYPCDKKYAENSMHMTHRWLKRCINHFDQTKPLYGHSQSLFPIVQGSTYPDLRKQSAEFIASQEREGNAIGGLSVGEPHEDMYAMTDLVCDILPSDKPRYLMGVGKPDDIVGAVKRGVDMFDCVLPTRSGRNGQAFTRNGVLNITNAKHAEDPNPIDKDCKCPACSDYSRAYIYHLVKSKEILGSMLMTWHNLFYYQELMSDIRSAISEGRFDEFEVEFRSKYFSS